MPVELSLGTHTLTVPWHLGPVNDRLNPAFMVSAERPLRSHTNGGLFYTLDVGLFQHYWWMTAISADSQLGIGRALPGGFHTDLRLGIGYMHYFWRRERLELVNGRYEPATDWGSPSIVVPFALTLGYRGREERPLSVSPFVSARWAAQILFLDEIPAATHLTLSLGARMTFHRPGRDQGR
jgi:hypothetical protein